MLEQDVDASLTRLGHVPGHARPSLLALDRLRPLDVDDLYTAWPDGMAESTVRRMHAILHAALTQADRWDLIVADPVDRIEPPRPRKARRRPRLTRSS